MPDNIEPKRQTAPDLPVHIAKQFGLHDELAAAEKPQAESGSAGHSLIDDPETDAAVDDIFKKESDTLLKGESAVSTALQPVAKKGFWAKVRRLFRAWWHNGWARWITIVLLVALVVTVAVIQKFRYIALNTIGVRSSASVVVLDETTKLPLKNVTVTLGSHKLRTDIKGAARFTDLKLGDYKLTITRIAFADYSREITIGWGSNPLGDVRLEATGIQYTLQLSDYVSGKPLEGAEVTSDEVSALADKTGKVVLTLDDTENTALAIVVGHPGYRSESLTMDANRSVITPVSLVPAVKDVYVSKQSGRYDVVSSDLDGKNRKVLIAGTGYETVNMSLVVSPDGARAAYVSSRDNQRDSDGYPMQSLVMIDITEGTSATVDRAQQIQLIDWIGDRLIYRSTVAGASAANSQRNRLIALHYETNAKVQLATANQFNTILSAKDVVYYAASSTDPNASLGFFRVKADGSSRKRIINDEVWTGIRSSYNTIHLQTPDGWYAYDIRNDKASRSDMPTELASYLFADDSTGAYSLWSDVRDGKGVLLRYDTAKDSHKVLVTQEGIGQPIRWAGTKAILFRVATSGEVANYVVSPDGGIARKVADASPVYGFAQGY